MNQMEYHQGWNDHRQFLRERKAVLEARETARAASWLSVLLSAIALTIYYVEGVTTDFSPTATTIASVMLFGGILLRFRLLPKLAKEADNLNQAMKEKWK